MSNVCLTDYAVTGPVAQLAELNDILATAEDKYRHGQVRDLRSQLDDADNYWRPAEWSDRRLTGDTLRLSTESPWAMPTEFSDALTRRYPELRVYWRYEICEEGENGTNDSEGRYFATGWNLEIEDCGTATYSTLDALATAEDKYRHGQVCDLWSQLDDADNYWRPAEWSDRRLTGDTLI